MTTVEQHLGSSGLLLLNYEPDFAPRDGGKLIEAKTTGCRYTASPHV